MNKFLIIGVLAVLILVCGHTESAPSVKSSFKVSEFKNGGRKIQYVQDSDSIEESNESRERNDQIESQSVESVESTESIESDSNSDENALI